MKRIKELRESLSLTQDALARLLNVSRSTLAKWESGVHYPPADSLVELSSVLHVSTDYLLEVTDQFAEPPRRRAGVRALSPPGSAYAPPPRGLGRPVQPPDQAEAQRALELAVEKAVKNMSIEEFLRLQNAGETVLEHVPKFLKTAEMIDTMIEEGTRDDITRKG